MNDDLSNLFDKFNINKDSNQSNISTTIEKIDRLSKAMILANIFVSTNLSTAAAKLVNLKTGEVICDSVQYFAGANKHVSHSMPDRPSRFKDKIGKKIYVFFIIFVESSNPPSPVSNTTI